MLEQPTSVPHTSSHTSGTTQPTSSTGGGNTHVKISASHALGSRPGCFYLGKEPC